MGGLLTLAGLCIIVGNPSALDVSSFLMRSPISRNTRRSVKMTYFHLFGTLFLVVLLVKDSYIWLIRNEDDRVFYILLDIGLLTYFTGRLYGIL